MLVEWSIIKDFADTRSSKLNYIDLGNKYWIKGIDNNFSIECFLDKNPSDTTDLDDFEDNYKDVGNVPYTSAEYNAANVHVLKPTEPSTKMCSHWWNDKTTWYQQSTRVTGETLTDSGDGLTFNSANANWINLVSGKIYQEDTFSSSYIAKIYIGGALQSTGYTIDYATGDVTFDSSQTGNTVTADYSHENGSLWTVAPDAGKMINIEHTEVQFSGDVKIPNAYFSGTDTTWFNFEIWVYNPADLPNKILYKQTRYKSEMDIINDANLAYTHPQFGNLPGTDDYLVLPFNYGSLQTLKSSQGAELRVSLKDDIPISGSFASLTVYFLSRDE